jgi:hypothetical protein
VCDVVVIETSNGVTQMTSLSPLAAALHSSIWPFISRSKRERCETIEEETILVNREIPELAAMVAVTPVGLLANLWGVHPAEAEIRRSQIGAAVTEAARADATLRSIYLAAGYTEGDVALALKQQAFAASQSAA